MEKGERADKVSVTSEWFPVYSCPVSAVAVTKKWLERC